MIGARGDSVRRSVSSFVWFPEVMRAIGPVVCVIPRRLCPLSALTEILWQKGTMEI